MTLLNRNSITTKIISLLVIVGTFVVLAKILIDNWNSVNFKELVFNYRLLLLAFIISIGILAYGAWLWQVILTLLDVRIKFMDAWRISAYSQVARYIPGKVWLYMGKIYWGNKIGISTKKILFSTFLETIFLSTGSFLIALFSIRHFINKGVLSLEYLLIISCSLIMVFIALYPRILEKIIRTIGKKWIKNEITLNFSYLKVLYIVFHYAIAWLLLGIQLYIFISSFYKISIAHWLYIASFNAISWLIGFLSFITPSGLGVKEGVFVFGLKTIVPVAFAIMCAIVIRLYTILVDCIVAIVFLIFDKVTWKDILTFKKSPPTISNEE